MGERSGYAFVGVAAGGLLVDLRSGVVFELNETAAFIWRLWLSGSSTEAVAQTMTVHYGVSSEIASADIERTLGVSMSASRARRPGDFHYERSARGYLHSFRGRPVLEVDARGERLWTVDRLPESQISPESLLHAIAPKLLALRGQVVLHASAVAIGERVLAFAGPSGAGKTTTARAAVHAGATAVSEDLLVVRVGAGTAHALMAAERGIDAWIRWAAPSVAAGKEVSCADLDSTSGGASVPLAEVAFLDAARRAPGGISARSMSSVSAASECFHNTFHGADTPSHWSRQLAASAAIAGHAAAFELTMPSDLSGLEAATGALVRRASVRS